MCPNAKKKYIFIDGEQKGLKSRDEHPTKRNVPNDEFDFFDAIFFASSSLQYHFIAINQICWKLIFCICNKFSPKTNKCNIVTGNSSRDRKKKRIDKTALFVVSSTTFNIFDKFQLHNGFCVYGASVYRIIKYIYRKVHSTVEYHFNRAQFIEPISGQLVK